MQVDSRVVIGLGHGELLQSTSTPCEFQAKIALNSYESNCLRDWLAHRWNSESLEGTCVSMVDGLGLIVVIPIVANNLLDARKQFDDWLDAVAREREQSHHSRK
ncbi:hypothetical protein [Limnobacter parvus]|uniref:Uncharacterized protein n=1 Tax=Limnobacter parvus TaxID=2939690 RepID=A0ABT1XIS2_9BURK|nr:hypothetical protein [Limnobacter parvus]MCR2746791.1 hypothetical protein [Limnobacter parvus]